MSGNVPNEYLYARDEDVRDHVVLVTGGALGLGRAAAIEFAKRGAKVSIGDFDIEAAHRTVEDIREFGGQAICFKVDVQNWDQLCAYFVFTMRQYGHIDIVIANAGISEVAPLMTYTEDKNGLPQPPALQILHTNVHGLINTSRLAIHFFKLSQRNDPSRKKALLLHASMCSFKGLVRGSVYCSSKHAVLGFAQSIESECHALGIRLTVISPWFTDTGMVPWWQRLVMAGIPYCPIDRVAGAIYLAAVDPDPRSHGAVYSIPDTREVFRVFQSDINEGITALLNERARQSFGLRQKIAILSDTLAVLWNAGFITKAVLWGSVGFSGYSVYRRYGERAYTLLRA